jgi:hypothetical protein
MRACIWYSKRAKNRHGFSVLQVSGFMKGFINRDEVWQCDRAFFLFTPGNYGAGRAPDRPLA